MITLSILLEKLADRFHSENDISDITYTLLQTDNEFKKMFLKYIFKDLEIEEIQYIQRELPEDNSRPDFVIGTSTKRYLIEVKKYDKNHHFDQYVQSFPEYERAYITNYEIEEMKEEYKDKYFFYTWKEIYDHLCKQNNNPKNETIQGYTKYLEKVCNFMEINDMRFGNLYNLAQFNVYVKEITENKYGNLILSPYDTKYNYSSTYSGTYFSLKKENTQKCIYPWFGVYYKDSIPIIGFTMEFAKGWCGLLKESRDQIYSELKKLEYGKIESEKDVNAIYVSLKEEKFNELQNTDDILKQKKILQEFLKEVIFKLGNFL